MERGLTDRPRRPGPGAVRSTGEGSTAVRSALPCGMRMGRIEFGLSVLASVLVTIAGVVLGLKNPGTDMATFGWVMAVVGAVFLVVNLVVRTRLR